MKKKDIPQDKSALENFTKEVYYVKNDEGGYETGLSEGWSVKKEALDNAWEDVEAQTEEARLAVEKGSKSPIYYFMKKNLMDVKILAAYTGFFSFKIKRHLKASGFRKMNRETMEKYADIFGISPDELKNFKG